MTTTPTLAELLAEVRREVAGQRDDRSLNDGEIDYAEWDRREAARAAGASGESA